MSDKLRLRRSIGLLQLLSLVLLGVGALSLLLGDFWLQALGGLALAAGGSGVVGLSFAWKRALVGFTMLTWSVAAGSAVSTALLVMHRDTNALRWTLCLANGLAAAPAAVLSTTLHLLRVWSGPRPLVSEQRTPLVDPAAAAAEAAAPAVVDRPICSWPPTAPPMSLASSQSCLLSSAQGSSSASGTSAAAPPAPPVWPPPPQRPM